ncbi:MAG: RDD family protein [Rhodospirillaceae bacterium]|nr:RDD family protein [Rhodospirillaceae bacterium]
MSTEPRGPFTWGGAAPDPLDHPELYEGVLLRRTLAYLIDFVLSGILLLAVLILGKIAGLVTFGLLAPVAALIVLLTPFAYFVWFTGGPRAATPGMRVFDLKLARWDGGSPDYIQAAVRTALFTVTVPTTSLLILIVMVLNDRRRALHDILSGTVVVNDKAVMILS